MAMIAASWWAFPLQGPGGGGLPGLGAGFAILGVLLLVLFLVLQIWATVRVVTGRLSLLAKVLWLLVIWIFPPFGALLYALFGRTR